MINKKAQEKCLDIVNEFNSNVDIALEDIINLLKSECETYGELLNYIREITIEFNSVDEYLVLKEKTAQEGQNVEQLASNISNYLRNKTFVNTSLR